MKNLSRQLRRMLTGSVAMNAPDLSLETLKRDYWWPDSAWLSLAEGIQLHYRDSGPEARERPTLVLLHGLMADVDVWSPLWPWLASHYRLIALDLPGHGLTVAPAGYAGTLEAYVATVGEALDALELEHFSLIGSSMGGLISWLIAARRPAGLETLTLIDAAGWPDTRPSSQRSERMMRLLGSAPLRPWLRHFNPDELVNSGMRDSFAPQPAPEAAAERYRRLIRLPGHRDILLNLARHWRTRPLASDRRLGAITVPALIIAGDRDVMIPIEHAQRFHRAIATSQLRIHAGCGHVPMLVAPERTADEIEQFIRQQTGNVTSAAER